MATRRKKKGSAKSVKPKVSARPAKKAAKAPARRAPAKALATDAIVQEVTLPAGPRVVWDAYLDAERHARFTGSGAAIDRRVGGRFRAYDGYIEGVILELAPPNGETGRLVQSWRASDFPPEYPHSTVEIVVAPAGRGTKLTLRHTGVPRAMVSAFAKGWQDFYWAPLKKMLRAK